ncbi:CobQ-like glutamine amidotransferase family enzyme [Microbacteriaceae bacterium SG_E_30_P1]|uniref:CobQ-like glutamine amidotransferase family enzyme n=1 Tax=Antiquaquibacter oligotrophicus TaxID=2880260 RepID=A0ABT6KPM3_9MICO|nr:cobyric acid synthase [Antiquaquibacter oligotrophicus]MDH6181047.1 CobQ-like glutamine amidotransferase family enzyme [Antiquaquibacter oligotrophicus]UDF13255.1 cobyric acid synthase [Antiquaquibacter oligotrophicus]
MISILHLYPRELGINGDVGNVLALTKRAQWRGVDVSVHNHDVGDELPDEVHVVHIGSGPASGVDLVRSDLARIAPRLREWADEGVPFLAVAAGWQLLGRTFTAENGELVDGAGVLPTDARARDNRVVREVWRDGVAGFENHGVSFTTDGVAAEWPVARFGSSLATTLHGPFLPMNPAFADDVLTVAADLSGDVLGQPEPALAEVDERARLSREAVRSRV